MQIIFFLGKLCHKVFFPQNIVNFVINTHSDIHMLVATKQKYTISFLRNSRKVVIRELFFSFVNFTSKRNAKYNTAQVEFHFSIHTVG
jgi:hypothetical protein